MARQQQSPRARVTNELTDDFVMMLFPPRRKLASRTIESAQIGLALAFKNGNFAGSSGLMDKIIAENVEGSTPRNLS
jgi:hypothetical protein